MAVRDFVLERRSVEIGGRRFTIRRVTVAAVTRALELFGSEIRLCWATAKQWPETWRQASIPGLVAKIPADEAKLVDVLRLVVSGDGEPSRWPLRELAEHVLGLSDLGRIASALDFESEPSEEEPLPIERDLVDLATRFSCAPHEIMDWPFEEYVAVLDVISIKRGERVGVNLLNMKDGAPVLPWLAYEGPKA